MKTVGITHCFDFFILLFFPDSYCYLCLEIEIYFYCMRNISDQVKNFRNKLEGNGRMTPHYATATLVDCCGTALSGGV